MDKGAKVPSTGKGWIAPYGQTKILWPQCVRVRVAVPLDPDRDVGTREKRR